MNQFDISSTKNAFFGPSFSFRNRLQRVLWQLAWMLLARWTPPPCHKWRLVILKVFGAKVSWCAYVYPDVEIWAPWNLELHDYATLARKVVCYNIARVVISKRAIVSQRATLCTGSHDYYDPSFPLIAKPITVSRRAWVCANAFVGPGVFVGEGAVLGASAVACRDLERWTVYVGNPAKAVKQRPVIND